MADLTKTCPDCGCIKWVRFFTNDGESCNRCAPERPKPIEYWARVSRYAGRPMLTCVECAERVEPSDEYYTRIPLQSTLINRVVKCVNCHEGTNYTDDDNRRELARMGADRWAYLNNRGTTTIKCDLPRCDAWIGTGDFYWRMIAGSVERPVPMYHCRKHTANNGIDHDVNMPREAPAGKLGSRRVGLLPEN